MVTTPGTETTYAPIPPEDPAAPPYEAVREAFTWEAARAGLAGLPDGGLNIAHEAVDRHVLAGTATGSRCAAWRSPARSTDLTYADLRR